MDNNNKTKQTHHSTWTTVAAILGALAVILGAFGAHGLKPLLSPESLANYQTGVLYHFIHTLALLLVSSRRNSPFRFQQASCISFTVGIVLFSGSLYLLSTASVTGLSVSFLGPITPIGGIALILGWVLLALPGKPSR